MTYNAFEYALNKFNDFNVINFLLRDYFIVLKFYKRKVKFGNQNFLNV